MRKEELEKLAEKYQKKADRAYDNYQATGIQRYDRESWTNTQLADALRMAAAASDTAERESYLRSEIIGLAHDADMLLLCGELTGEAETLAKRIVSIAVLYCKYKKVE